MACESLSTGGGAFIGGALGSIYLMGTSFVLPLCKSYGGNDRDECVSKLIAYGFGGFIGATVVGTLTGKVVGYSIDQLSGKMRQVWNRGYLIFDLRQTKII